MALICVSLCWRARSFASLRMTNKGLRMTNKDLRMTSEGLGMTKKLTMAGKKMQCAYGGEAASDSKTAFVVTP